ncbi:MAG: hypothetical protein U0R79_02505 [Propionicimonas sp.]
MTFTCFAPSIVAAAEPADDLRVPLSTAPVPSRIIAASGTNILASANDEWRLSADNGHTWQPSALDGSRQLLPEYPLESNLATFVDYDGRSVSVYDLSSNAVTEYDVPSGAGDIWGADGEIAVTAIWNDDLWDYDLYSVDLATGEVDDLWYESDSWPAGSDSNDVADMYAWVSPAGVIVQTDYVYDGNNVATDIDPVAIDGFNDGDPFRVKGYVPYVGLVGDRVEYIKRVGTSVSLCSRPFDDTRDVVETCASVATLGSSSQSVSADRCGDVLRLELNGVEYTWEAKALKKVTYSGSSAVWSGSGASARPLLHVKNGSTSAFFQVLPDGTTQKLFDDFGDPIAPYYLDLAADRVAGFDKRLSAWSRSLSAEAIGPEAAFGAHTSYVALSSGRTVVEGETALTFYDRGTKKSTFATTGSLVDASGPYALVNVAGKGSIRTSSGAVAAANPVGIFGTRYVSKVDASHFRVLDVADPQFSVGPVELTAGMGTWTPFQTRMWGDWVSVDMELGDAINTRVYNVAHNEWGGSYENGLVISLGDGVAVVRDRTAEKLVLWNYVTDERVDIEGDIAALDDGNHLVYADDDELIVTTVPGAGASAPRILGMVAPSTSFNPNAGPWKVDFDATKPLAESVLEISHGTGEDKVIDKVITVPASTDGSLRGVSWDGRNGDGEWLADGDYAWTLRTAVVSDESPALVAIDGTSPVTGIVTVKAANLGTATGPTPKISDTTPTVAQTLTATPGAWTPVNVQLAYQWYRGTTAIPGATAPTYAVQPADAGQALKVKVTGSCPGTESFCRGYATASKTSAATSTVAKATITPAPVPTLDATSAVVDTPITATTGVWGPDPVTLSFQWYKVNSKGTSSAIKGATSTTFTPTGAEVGYKLKLKVTGTKPGYTTKGVYSALTGKVATANFTSVADPTVTGSVKVGMPLTAVPGASDPAASYSYQWYRGTSTISGATAATYRATSTDLGKQIRVRVTYKRSGYVSVSRYSAFTGAIEPGIIAVTPKLDDTTPVVGQVLRITDATSIGSWNPSDATAAYQWYRDTTAIPGATEATYEVQSADVGKAIKVKVTGSKDGYASVAKTSAASSDVAKGTFTTKPVPTIEGELTVGSTLTAVHGDWSPAPTSFTYAWYRSGTAITGQAASTYTVVAADAGRTITVKVTAVRSGFTSASATSAGVLIPA